MKPKVYVETSTISYVVARPSRDLIIAANQQVTREWWTNHRSQKKEIAKIAGEQGYELPIICTPYELMGK